MAWRKWIVRGIVYGILGACAAGALAYQRWTNPGAVREQIIIKAMQIFPGTEVSVDSAHLRLFGGIQLNGLRMCRKDDPEKHEFLQIPSAIFYHDKEKVLDGELTLRKIELMRPRLRARRERDGTWNLQNLMRPAGDKPKTPLPAIVIHQGTLILEDHIDPTKTTLLEINDVNMTIINDPLPKVTIRGAASSDLLGKLALQGTFDRNDNEAFVSFRAVQIPLTQTLASRLPIKLPEVVFNGLQMNATASVEGKVSYHPTLPQKIYYDVHAEIKDGALKHPLMLLPMLTNIDVKLHCTNGALQIESLTARSGATEIEAHGMAQLPHIDQEFELQLDCRHVMLGEELAKRLPDKIRNLHTMFQPNGPTSIHCACARHEGQWVALTSEKPSMVSLRPENIALAFKGFPYPLERTTGKVDYNLLNKRVDVQLEAHAGDRPVILHGNWTGDGDQADVDFKIEANDVTIDDKLLQALSFNTVLQNFAASFHATGKINVKSVIKHEPGQKFRNEFRLHFHDAAICWDNFPLALKKLSGNLDIYHDHWEFHEFQAVHNGGHILVHGQSTPKDEKHGITLEIAGVNVPLSDELREALRPMPGLHKAWETFRPQGNLFFTASVKRPTSDPRDLDVDVDARGASAKPLFFPYLIQDINGKFRFHENRLTIAKLRAKHYQSLIALDHGAVDINPRGGYFADFTDLNVAGFRLDEEFVDALPGKLQTAAKALNLNDPLRVSTRVVIAQAPETGRPPDVYWKGMIWMSGLKKITTGLPFTDVTGELGCEGRYDGRQIVGVEGNVRLEEATLYDQPFKNVRVKFEMRKESPDVLLIGLRAPIYGGDVTGQVRVDFNSSLSYKLNLTASQINVAEFGRHNVGTNSQLSGIADARLSLSGLATGMESLEGNGAINIPHGHIYNLPFLLDLLKFLGLRLPDRTAFEEFHTAFNIQGSKVNVQRLDLLGSAVSLSGKGEVDILTRKLELDVYPVWGRIEQFLPASVRSVPATFSKNLLTVEIRGKASSNSKDLKFFAKPFPIVANPLLLFRDQVIGPQGLGASGNPPPEPRNPPLDLPR